MFTDKQTVYVKPTWRLNTSYLRGNLQIFEDDERSYRLSSVDLNRILLVSVNHADEAHISGEERIARLKNKKVIRLDARFLRAALLDQDKIPEYWKFGPDGKARMIHFDGTIAVDSVTGHRYVFGIFWNGDMWEEELCWLLDNSSFLNRVISFVYSWLGKSLVSGGYSAVVDY